MSRNRRADWRRIKGKYSYTIEEAARALNLHRNTVRNWVRRGGLPAMTGWRPHLVLGKPRRVIAKVEWHPGELYPRVGFIVTNLSRPAERVVAFYNQRGTAEQWIKEGKNAIKWTRLSCCSFAANPSGSSFMRCSHIDVPTPLLWTEGRFK
jgi:hypothetical protein